MARLTRERNVVRGVVRKGLLVAFGVAMAFVIGEGALRLCGCTRLPMHIPGTRGIARFADRPEGYFRWYWNSAGYRTAEIGRKGDTEERILVVGDSHTEGAGIDDGDRFSDRLEQYLNGQRNVGRVTVMNFGQAGVTAPGYLEIIRTGLAYGPDLVMLVVFSGNDLAELVSAKEYLGVRAERKPPGDRLWEAVKARLRRLYLYHTAAHVFRGLRANSRAHVTVTGPYLQALGQAKYFIERPVDLEAALDRFRHLLYEIKKESEARDIRFLVVTLPSKLQVDEASSQEAGREIAQELRIELDHARRVDAFVHRRMVDVVREIVPHGRDLRDPLKEAWPSREKFWPRDWHLNTLGHEVVARALLDYYMSETTTGSDRRVSERSGSR